MSGAPWLDRWGNEHADNSTFDENKYDNGKCKGDIKDNETSCHGYRKYMNPKAHDYKDYKGKEMFDNGANNNQT